MNRLATNPAPGHEPVTPFTPAVLFLSTATRPEGMPAGSEPIKILVQREAGHRLAHQHGLGIIKEFVEIGAPATSLRRRPSLRRMLAYLERDPDIRFAIFPAPQRFSRDFAAFQQLRERFQKLGVEIMVPTGDRLTPPDPRTFAALMAGGPAV